MPKLKTKSSAKKRFSVTASGKVKMTQAGKKHFLRRRTKSQLRNLRGTTMMKDMNAHNVLKYFLPYGTN